MSDALIDALKAALVANPANPPLWLHLSDHLLTAGRNDEAADTLRQAIGHGADLSAATAKLSPVLRDLGLLAEALIRVEQAMAASETAELRLELARVQKARGNADEALVNYDRAVALNPNLATAEFDDLRSAAKANPAQTDEPAMASVQGEEIDVDQIVAQFEEDKERITFADVVGLDDVKKQIHLRIIAPMKKKSIFQAFSRRGGGGILLYGPPGCGKTFVARATAGELGARFVTVGIHDIIDKFWGESEKMLHALFDDARQRAPTVLFFDEFDALGSARGRSDSHFWTLLVDQLLAEMDGIHGQAEDVLVFAATNMPWNVDSAFRRPGRFDRMLFVPPPDELGRAEMLRRHVQPIPGGDKAPVDVIAKKTHLFTGADLKSLCERASDSALTRSLETDAIHPVTAQDFLEEVEKMRSSAHEWLTTARNYARYANESGQYDDLAAFLRKVKMN